MILHILHPWDRGETTEEDFKDFFEANGYAWDRFEVDGPTVTRNWLRPWNLAHMMGIANRIPHGATLTPQRKAAFGLPGSPATAEDCVTTITSDDDSFMLAAMMRFSEYVVDLGDA